MCWNWLYEQVKLKTMDEGLFGPVYYLIPKGTTKTYQSYIFMYRYAVFATHTLFSFVFHTTSPTLLFLFITNVKNVSVYPFFYCN